jgi:hypothetical protein
MDNQYKYKLEPLNYNELESDYQIMQLIYFFSPDNDVKKFCN